MATIFRRMNNLRLSTKLAIIFAVSISVILGVSFFAIYSFSERKRNAEFYHRLKDKTITTYKVLVEVDQIDSNLLSLFDQNTINTLGDEEILLFDSSGSVIYSSTPDTAVAFAGGILALLQHKKEVFRRGQHSYQIFAMPFFYKGKRYYGLAKAYDEFGRNTIHFLIVLLISTFAIALLIIIPFSIVLSKIMTRPINRLTEEIENLSPNHLSVRLSSSYAADEIGFLAGKFNELLGKVENTFSFQHHFINHLSHELKTPLAIMMANAERALTESDIEKLKRSMQFHKDAIMNLSNIIVAMLEISKTEKSISGITSEIIRIDEILFECIDEIMFLEAGVMFDFHIDSSLNENTLSISGNSRMLKMAIMNLVKNAANFSQDKRPSIEINAADGYVAVLFQNDGALIPEVERPRLFKHLFRGSNSASIKGFGLGLVLADRIVKLHSGQLQYEVVNGRNCFILRLPLSMPQE